MTCEHHKKCGDCFSPAFVRRQDAEIARLRAEVARLREIIKDAKGVCEFILDRRVAQVVLDLGARIERELAGEPEPGKEE